MENGLQTMKTTSSTTDKVHPWLKGGKHSSPCLTMVAKYLCAMKVKSVLDTGCGNGDLMTTLIRLGITEVRGCDIEPDHAKIARTRTKRPVAAKAFYDENPYPAQTYDAVVAINWLHNDWEFRHATGISKKVENSKRLSRVIKALEDSGAKFFIWDWRDEGANKMVRILVKNGWKQQAALTLPRDKRAKNLIYVYKKED